MHRETKYDEIFDAQRHFRTLLDSMARPGKLNRLAPLPINPPPQLHRSAASIGLALLNRDVSFSAQALSASAEDYFHVNTSARPGSAASADFIWLPGDEPAGSELINGARLGPLAYPDLSATVIIQVDATGRSSSTGGLVLSLAGPGIETRETICVTGLAPQLIDALQAVNREFPLGIDAFLAGADDTVIGLPRTTRITWERL